MNMDLIGEMSFVPLPAFVGAGFAFSFWAKGTKEKEKISQQNSLNNSWITVRYCLKCKTH